MIGPNGSGKTTLLRIILGQLAPDSGGAQFNPGNLRIGYLAQGLDAPDETPVWDILFPRAAALRAVEAEIERLAQALTSAGDMDVLLEEYSAALEQLEQLSQRDQIDGSRADSRPGWNSITSNRILRWVLSPADKKRAWDWRRCC